MSADLCTIQGRTSSVGELILEVLHPLAKTRLANSKAPQELSKLSYA